MTTTPAESSRRLTKGWIRFFVVVEMLVAGAAAFVLVLFVVPGSLDVETFCVFGESTHAADMLLLASFVTLIATGVATLAYVCVRAERCRRVWWLVPPVWLVVLIVAEAVIADRVGAQACGGGSLF